MRDVRNATELCAKEVLVMEKRVAIKSCHLHALRFSVRCGPLGPFPFENNGGCHCHSVVRNTQLYDFYG